MSELIDAVKTDDHEAVARLLSAHAAVNQEDEHGWTALAWSAGRGNVAMIRLLLEHGADAAHTGQDLRMPATIALTAGHRAAAELLESAAQAASAAQAYPQRSFCKGYQLHQLRQFSGWQERFNSSAELDAAGDSVTNEMVVFLHDDLSVTVGVCRGEEVVFDQVTPEWRAFCTEVLDFRQPTDAELVPALDE